jgi:tetratricopeptide (TPR) repeat protein
MQSQNVEAAQELLATAGPLEDEANALRDVELSLLERDALHVPDNAALQTRLGLLRYLRGWRKEAVFALETANRLEPRSPEYPYHLAIYLRDTGRPREALTYARRLRALRPDDERFVNLENEIRQHLRAGPSQ